MPPAEPDQLQSRQYGKADHFLGVTPQPPSRQDWDIYHVLSPRETRGHLAWTLFFRKPKRCGEFSVSSPAKEAESQRLHRSDYEKFLGLTQEDTCRNPTLYASDLTKHHNFPQLALRFTSILCSWSSWAFFCAPILLSNFFLHFPVLSTLPFYYMQPKTVCLGFHGSFHFHSHFSCCWSWRGSGLEFRSFPGIFHCFLWGVIFPPCPLPFSDLLFISSSIY